jgi:hypothetical protein
MAGIGLATALAGCQNIPGDTSIADYCANANNADESVCRLKVEIDGNATALAETNMSLSEARALADDAVASAAAAQASADDAMAAAAAAQSTADQALDQAGLDCMTNVVQKSDIGTCAPGYTVMGCSQTRYTTRAGGLSFLREVNSDQCRFNSRVLEMHVRCCRAAPDGADS